MKKHLVRPLRADEIECRAALVKRNGLSLLLYKDARVDQRILDETFGPFGWQRSHQCINGNLYCTVEIYDQESGLWIAKQDVGTTGYAEKEKSQASDSFKRACFNWGIGRELYSAPFIWIPAEKASIQRDGERLYCTDHFSVYAIGYNEDREITALTIGNDSRQRQVVYELRGAAAPEKHKPEKNAENNTGLSNAQMKSLEKELQRTGVEMDMVRQRYQIGDPKQMSEETYQKVMAALAKTKPAA